MNAVDWIYTQILHLVDIYVFVGTSNNTVTPVWHDRVGVVLPWLLPKRLYDMLLALFAHDHGNPVSVLESIPIFGHILRFVFHNYGTNYAHEIYLFMHIYACINM